MVPMPIELTIPNNVLPEEIEKALRKGFVVLWNETDEAFESCRNCRAQKGFCGFNESNRFACFPHESISSAYESSPVESNNAVPRKKSNNAVPRKKSNNAVGIGVGIGASVCSLMFAALLFRVFHRRRLMTVHKRLSPTSNVERFLEEYIHEMPTRYSYHQLQKITNNFAAKVGEGGFGVVFKGKLPNGNFVAVKILHPSSHSESQFINEVATIGRIHHVNLVRLMGYCFDGSKSALVYEFMANGSLEKFIFSENGKNHILSWEQSYSIAVGAARGMSYLHQDCQRRIIHFDIKPHNILLDEDFTPKIADFGLAKICGRGEDHISLTGTRGTLGYAAPEICLRSLGPVTDKSDVYSFGMLLLEMVGARKNIDVRVSRSSQLYFPDWVFKLMQNGKLEMMLNGRGRGEIGCEDELKATRLTKVGLWCIQYSSTDRPSMSKVVQMLEGNGEDVSTPPMPFNSSITATLLPKDTVSESSSS